MQREVFESDDDEVQLLTLPAPPPHRRLMNETAWRALLYGELPFTKSLVHASLDMHFQQRIESGDDRLRLDQKSRRLLATSEQMITTFMVDDIVEALLRPVGARVHYTMCKWMSSYLVPVYSALHCAGTKETQWHANMSARLFGVDAHSQEKAKVNKSKELGVARQFAQMDRALRKLAHEIRALTDRCRGGAHALLVVPVYHDVHFWLYIVDVKNRTLEYYNSLPAHLRRTVSDNVASPARSADSHRTHVAHILRTTHSNDNGGVTKKRRAAPERNEFDEERRKRVCKMTHRGIADLMERADVNTFHCALLWFFCNYLDTQLTFVDYNQRRPKQENATDCGVFVCMYAYLRSVSPLRYKQLVERVGQVHVDSFRRFLLDYMK